MDEKPDKPSGDPQFYRDAITAWFMETADSMKDFLPPEAIAQYKAKCIEHLESQFREGLWSKVERYKLTAFIERLLERQGVTQTDFESLYHRKAELDRKLLGPDDS